MKVIIILGLVALAAAGVKEKFANINLEEVLSNDKLVISTAKCVLEEGPCTSEAKDFKELLQEGKANHCADCSSDEKQKFKQIAQHLNTKHNEYYVKIVAKYDPDGKFADLYT